MNGEAGSERDDDVSASPWRTLQYLALTRLVIAIALLLSIAAFGTTVKGWSSPAYLGAAAVYFLGAAALAVAATYLRRRVVALTALQIAFDLALITALMVASGGLRSGLVVLYLLPVAGAALLLPTAAVFSVCALVVISILLDTLARTLTLIDAHATMVEAGLFGAMMFAVTGLLRLLTQRLSAQEQLAQQRGRNLHNQLAINRLVIAQLDQGVVVVDSATRVRANNRAARLLFGMQPEAQLTGELLSGFDRLSPLVAAFNRWRTHSLVEGSRSASIVELPEMRLRVRLVRPAAAHSDEYVIFVEDLRAIDERAQQLKLASMGRLTASIAHEIRNPLAAVSHASQLLLEDAPEGGLRRLAAIVRENTQRLNRLVDDILRVARREAPLGDDIELAVFVRDWLQDFLAERKLPATRIAVHVPASLRVKFEQSHLRQVLYNLLDNALRYASEADGSVRLVAGIERGGAALWVLDDGPGVAESVRNSLFEPFSTTHSKGTGLGLYIAREFCLANRGDLAYGRWTSPRGEPSYGFVLRFVPAQPVAPQEADFLDTMVPYE